ncbi:hypothetical protein DMENIID0001_138210 [Sergentomyia squamirostris]
MGETGMYKSIYWKTMGSAFSEMLSGERFVDVTLVCEGHRIQCHRIVLAACSYFFDDLLKDLPAGQYPVIILPKDVKFWMIQALLEFMYQGEISVDKDGIDELVKCAEILQIRFVSGSLPLYKPNENLQPSSEVKTEVINLIDEDLPESQPDSSKVPSNQTIQEDLLIPLETRTKKRKISKIDEDSKDHKAHEENQPKPSTSFIPPVPSVPSGSKDDAKQGYKITLRRKSAVEWEVKDREYQTVDYDSDLEKSWPSLPNFAEDYLSDTDESHENFVLIEPKNATRPKKFTNQDMKKALMKIQEGMSVHKAGLMYNINRSSLHKYAQLNNIKSNHTYRGSVEKKGRGRPPKQ